MANRYWVGGSASWDGTAGTKWALTDGGAGGQAIPTSTDDVFFTATSGAVTVTLVSGWDSCKNLNCTGFTGTLTSSSFCYINIYGDATLSPTMTCSGSWGLFYLNTSGIQKTITSNGKTIPQNISIGGGGTQVSVILGDNLIIGGSLSISGDPNGNGYTKFDTAGYNVTIGDVTSGFSGDVFSTSELYLRSSIITTPIWNVQLHNGGILNGGTSTIIINGTDDNSAFNGNFNDQATPNAGSYYNLTLSGTAGKVITVYDSSTFNNLTITSGKEIRFESAQVQTINNIFTAEGTTAPDGGIYIRSDTDLVSSFTDQCYFSSNNNQTVRYCTIRNSVVTGQKPTGSGLLGTGTWTAYLSNDAGHNNGWIFPSSMEAIVFARADDSSSRKIPHVSTSDSTSTKSPNVRMV